MRTVTTKCVILGHTNLGESDKIIYLYSDELGKIRAIAKGARKITSKFTGHLETLNFCTVELYFSPRNTIIREIITNKSPFKKRKSFKTLSNALKIAEITNQALYENQTLENLTQLLKNAVKQLSKSRKKDLVARSYTIKLLDKCGYIPDTEAPKIEKIISQVLA